MLNLYANKQVQEGLLESGTREQLIDWLQWNDPNGTYGDIDCLAEGLKTLDLETARALMRRQIDDSGLE